MILSQARPLNTAAALLEGWAALPPEDRLEAFHLLPPGQDDDLFFALPTAEQAALLLTLPAEERRLWIRALPPDDVADLLQQAPDEERGVLLALLDEAARREVKALLAYAEDAAGGLMSPRFAALRAEMTVDEAVRYLRRQAQANLETIYYAYVLDPGRRLLGTVSFRELFAARGDATLASIMETDLLTVSPDDDQERVARVIAQHDLLAVPVVDAAGVMKGIVTVDDVVDVVNEAATEDIHKLGGLEALDVPYLEAGLGEMLRKRAGWLALLFVGEMLTASAMARYEEHIAQAVVLAVFVPLVISSGGNSGSQAATLTTRALALGEVAPADAVRVLKRELAVGLMMGGMLAVLGFLRVAGWELLFGAYGAEWLPVAIALAASLVGVVLWGTLAGALLPLLIRRLGLDPASASAPLVATLVDVSGLVIYFTVAGWALGL